jgi:hypothetical protein
MPHVLDVLCPSCGSRCVFEFAEAAKIRHRSEVAAFQAHRHLDYELVEDRNGARYHQAVFYAGLALSSVESLRDLPDGYAPSDWAHSQYLTRRDPSRGAIRCARCGLRARHTLRWPTDAAFSVLHKGQVLWAFHRESAVDLRDFIASTDRTASDYRWALFLRKVPGHFLGAKDRERIVKQLDRLLEGRAGC